jgi:RNA polymerase sigma-70 factor (ECF subfamily)
MDEHPEPTPEADLELLRRRDPGAVESWFRRHADLLYTFVYYRVGRDEELATEVVQETFLTALRRIGDYDPSRGAMLAWLTYTARNCIRGALRQKRRYAAALDYWGEVDRGLFAVFRNLAHAPLADEILEKKETADLVRMALSNLPEHYRRALTRHYCGHESLREIARSQGISEGAVKSLLHRARLAFKNALERLAASLDKRTSAERLTP